MKTLPAIKSPSEIAVAFGCTIKQARQQLERNRAGMLGLLQKARQTGRKVNGYTESELAQHCIRFNAVLAQ